MPELTLLAANEPAARHLLAQPAIAPHIARQTREALAEVASRADRNMKQRELTDITFDYRMFGKSGTAQVAIPGERGYVPDQYISSFVAGAPLENPRLVCLVLIDDPCPELVRKRQHFGSWVAGPPVRRVLERSLRYLGVPPDAQQDAPREDAPRPPLAAVAG